jgi:hypothetical protein
MKRYTLEELEGLPDLCIGQADTLKVDDDDGIRVWLCRCGVADGMPYDNQVTVEEINNNGRWLTVDTYQAR